MYIMVIRKQVWNKKLTNTTVNPVPGFVFYCSQFKDLCDISFHLKYKLNGSFKDLANCHPVPLHNAHSPHVTPTVCIFKKCGLPVNVYQHCTSVFRHLSSFLLPEQLLFRDADWLFCMNCLPEVLPQHCKIKVRTLSQPFSLTILW